MIMIEEIQNMIDISDPENSIESTDSKIVDDNLPVILVAEDEPSLRKLFCKMIEREGWRAISASDGEEALEKALADPPDVIMMDIIMPRQDGFQATAKLKKNPETRHIPIVIVTALDQSKHRIKALEIGADDFITKPLNALEFRARIRNLLKVKAYNDHMRYARTYLNNQVMERSEELSKAYKLLHDASMDTIVRLCRAAEYKDQVTGTHILRVSYTAEIIANNSGCDPQDSKNLLYAAPMHDIGKIGIPDTILLKPGRLNYDEWEVMKTHTTIGAKILEDSDSSIIQLGEVVALSHHEWWDGTGYPKGLGGKEIPLPGRIVSIADTFDALLSKRPYKEAFDLEKSLEIMKDESGTHLDPDLLEVFFTSLEEILAARAGCDLTK